MQYTRGHFIKCSVGFQHTMKNGPNRIKGFVKMRDRKDLITMKIKEKIDTNCFKRVKWQIYLKNRPIVDQIISGTKCDGDNPIFFYRKRVSIRFDHNCKSGIYQQKWRSEGILCNLPYHALTIHNVWTLRLILDFHLWMR